jgi:hypothetical protein
MIKTIFYYSNILNPNLEFFINFLNYYKLQGLRKKIAKLVKIDF